MIQNIYTCKKCDSTNIVRNGKNKSGSQTYKCKDCGGYRVVFSVKKTENIDMDALAKTYKERNSYRSAAQVLGSAM